MSSASTPSKADISIVIPFYNEEDNIAQLCERLSEVTQGMDRVCEVIMVNDGSTDSTGERLREVAETDDTFRVIQLARNFGQTAAMMAGIDYASGEIIIPMDGDGQNDPADIPRLLQRLDEGFDVVSGWRKERKDSAARTFASRMANRLISRISGVHLHDYGCSLKAYRREVIEDIRLYGEMHRFVPVYATWQGGKVTEITVTHHPRRSGRSNYGFNRIFKVLLDLMVVQFLLRYDTKPIYVFGLVGFISIAMSFAAGFLALYLKFFEGFSFTRTPLPLLTALTLLTGVICILMGLMTELIVRTYYESQGKTIYRVREQLGFDAD